MHDLGDQKIEVSALPDGFESGDLRDWLETFLRETQENDVDMREEISNKLAASLARSAAIGYGRSMQSEEMRELLDQLFACSEPAMTVDGKAIFKILPSEDLDKLFN